MKGFVSWSDEENIRPWPSSSTALEIRVSRASPLCSIRRRFAKQLSQRAPPGPWKAFPELRLRVLRWAEASRCSFELALSPASGSPDLIGKVYAEDRGDVYRAMREIWQAGFDSEHEFAIPRPVAFLAPLRLPFASSNSAEERHRCSSPWRNSSGPICRT